MFRILGMILMLENFIAHSEILTPIQEVQFHLRQRNLHNQTIAFQNLSLNVDVMKQLNLTEDKVRNGWIESNGTVNEFVTSTGKRFIINIKTQTEKKVVRETLHVDITSLQNLTFDDLKDDLNLRPVLQPTIDMEYIVGCPFLNLEITMGLTYTEALINSNKIFRYDKRITKTATRTMEEEGILMTTFNSRTCNVTFHQLFYTARFGSFRQLNSALDSVMAGNLVALTSLGEASLLLDNLSITRMTQLGSWWSNYFSLNDKWAHIFIMGGPTLLEAVIPDVGNWNTTSDLLFHVSLPGRCASWPESSRWRVRKIFCEKHDGYGKLCDCNKPLDFPPSKPAEEFNPSLDIPIAISTSENRSRIITRLLEGLSKCGVRKDLITISFDKFDEKTATIANILGLKTLKCEASGGDGSSRINHVLKFSLYNQLILFPKAKQIILLEDDILVAQDFYQYMQETSLIFDLDPTVWCVSGFNLFSFPHTGVDPSRLYRGPHYPSWGWMMPRSILEDILPKWIPYKMEEVDWDLYLTNQHINKGRICLVPDVLRSTHGPNIIIHREKRNDKNRKKAALYAHSLIWSIVSSVGDIFSKLLRKNFDTYRLKKDIYNEDIKRMLKIAVPLNVTSISTFMPPKSEDNLFVIYLNKSSDNFDMESKLIRKSFGVYDDILYDVLDVIQFSHFNSTILLVHHPCIYSDFIPENFTFFKASPDEIEIILQEDEDYLVKQKIRSKKYNYKKSILSDLEKSYISKLT